MRRTFLKGYCSLYLADKEELKRLCGVTKGGRGVFISGVCDEVVGAEDLGYWQTEVAG